jgi:hypothetical protein
MAVRLDTGETSFRWFLSLLARHLDVRIQAKGTATLSSLVQQLLGHCLARDLVSQLVAVFKDAGAGYIEVQHIAANVPAGSFWQDAGFDVCGVTRRKFL